jgi:hypothetical protein
LPLGTGAGDREQHPDVNGGVFSRVPATGVQAHPNTAARPIHRRRHSTYIAGRLAINNEAKPAWDFPVTGGRASDYQPQRRFRWSRGAG